MQWDGTEDFPGYREVFEISNNDWEWATLRVYEKDGRLFYGWANGCSCNGYTDYVSEGDLIELPTLESARTAIREFFFATSSYFRYEEPAVNDRYLNAVEKFRELGLR